MRGWIMGGHGTCAVQGLADDLLELGDRPLAVVVHDRVVELRRERELALGDVEPLVDFALALRCAQPEAPLALLAAGRGHEDRDGGRYAIPDRQRTIRLDLEHRRAPLDSDALELLPERSRAVTLAPRQLHPLQEATLLQLPGEVLVAQEPVVATVLLARSHRARGRRNRQLELVGEAFDQELRERTLALSRRSRQDEDGPSSLLSG